MAYTSTVTASVSGGSLHVLLMAVVGMKMAADVVGGDEEWEPSVKISGGGDTLCCPSPGRGMLLLDYGLGWKA